METMISAHIEEQESIIEGQTLIIQKKDKRIQEQASIINEKDQRIKDQLAAIEAQDTTIQQQTMVIKKHNMQTVKLFDIAEQNCQSLSLQTLSGQSVDKRHFSVINWHPDGVRLACGGSANNSIHIWDGIDGKELITLTGHSDTVTCVSWRHDGVQLASGSHDKSIKIWDVGERRLVKTLNGHTSSVSSVSWHPDGKRLVSGSLTDSIKIWDVVEGHLLKSPKVHPHRAVL